MTTFRTLMQGKRARRTVEFPRANERCSLLPPLAELEAQRAADKAENQTADSATEPGSAVAGAPDERVLVDLVVLTGTEEDEALKAARAHAIAQGVADPRPNEPIYDLALMVETLLRGCLDHESSKDAPRPFFESAQQIRAGLDRDRIAYLHALHEQWQDDCSPTTKNPTEGEFYAWLIGVAESESPSDFFAKLARGTLWIYVRTLAKLWLTSPQAKSAVGSTSAPNTPNTMSSAEAS